jgi:uncharacterized membrane-anchored protein YitT (DUF2179 family)
MDVTYALLNILLLVAGFLFLGKTFGFKTIYVIALSSVLFWILPEYFPNLEVVDPELDKIMVVLIGGAMESIGIGMILLRGGSTGQYLRERCISIRIYSLYPVFSLFLQSRVVVW